LAFAFGAGGNGPVSAYTYGWSFMQMPYAVVVVSVIGVLTPQLAQHATDGNFEALSERLRFGLRQSLVIIVPATIVMITLAQPLVAILLHHLDASSRLPAGTVLAILAAGLPGFTVFQLCVRGLQSMQRAREVFWLYAVENALNIALAFVIGRTSLSGLTASVSLAYTATAVIALVVLRQHKVHIAGAIWGVHVRRSLLASVIAGLAMVIVYAAFTSSVGLGLLERFGATVVTGLGAYVSTVNIAQGRATRSRRKMQGLQSPKGSNGQRTNRH
jgi:putative peptidoglycan lipid II flippase